jgi:hypothetical protein
MKNNKGVVDIYGGTIPFLRNNGVTLEEIGITCGNVTKQRICQILKKFYPEALYPSRQLVSTSKATKMIGMNGQNFEKIAGKMNIKPSRVTLHRVLWNISSVKLIIAELNKKKCRICGKSIPRSRSVYCGEICYQESRKYRSWDKEAKKIHNEQVKKWANNNPERIREMNKRARLKYRSLNRISPLNCIICGSSLKSTKRRKYCFNCKKSRERYPVPKRG